MTDYFKDVGEFHRKFGLPRYDDGRPPQLMEVDVMNFRHLFMQEELDEFLTAHVANNLEDAADALADLVYVALGTAHMMGLPMDDVWREVQRANMTKVRAKSDVDPLSKRMHRLDVVKPPGFAPPDHWPAIERARRAARLEQARNYDSTLYAPDKWDARFVALAEHVASWSKDPRTKVGAVVVAAGDRRKVAHGYNGFPPGVGDTAERLADRDTKNKLVQHAEQNALDNATFDVRGGTLYVTGLHVCSRCALTVASRRLARVVCPPLPEDPRWRADCELAREVLKEAGVAVDAAGAVG